MAMEMRQWGCTHILILSHSLWCRVLLKRYNEDLNTPDENKKDRSKQLAIQCLEGFSTAVNIVCNRYPDKLADFLHVIGKLYPNKLADFLHAIGQLYPNKLADFLHVIGQLYPNKLADFLHAIGKLYPNKLADFL